MVNKFIINGFFKSGSELLKKFSTNVSNLNNIQPIQMAYKIISTIETKTTNPLIIMHGLLGSKQNWRAMGKALENKLSPSRTIYSVDARNHGESPHSPDHTYDHLASDILEFLKQHNINKAILMGHSMGGRAMMNFALNYPDFVEKLIVVDITPVSQKYNFETPTNIMKAMKDLTIPNEIHMKDARKFASEKLKNFADQGTVDFVLLNLKKLASGSFSWTVNLNSLVNNYVNIQDFPELSKKFSGPVLFIGGTKSKFIGRDELQEIRKWFPKAELKWVDAGHVIHFEKPNEFRDLVTDFVNNNN